MKPAVWVAVVQIAKHSITLKEQLRESDLGLQNPQRKVQVANSAFLEALHLALRKQEETRSCCQKLNGAEAQQDLAREKVTSVEAANAEAAI